MEILVGHGLIGNDVMIDLGSGYDWLTGGHGDDVIVSGNYVDEVWGDYRLITTRYLVLIHSQYMAAATLKIRLGSWRGMVAGQQ